MLINMLHGGQDPGDIGHGGEGGPLEFCARFCQIPQSHPRCPEPAVTKSAKSPFITNLHAISYCPTHLPKYGTD